MIVVDASAVIDFLLSVGAAKTVTQLLSAPQDVHVPHVIDLEVAQVLRRRVLARTIEPARGQAALGDLALLPFYRHPHDFLLPRVWELRHNISAYDAVYVALAEYLGVPLLTKDRRLANAPGHYAQIDLI